MEKMVHIAIVATVRCLDLVVNPLPQSAETILKCGKDYGYFCQKRSGKTNKNLHLLLLKNMQNSSIMNNIISVKGISSKQIIELHQHRHQLRQTLGKLILKSPFKIV